ncbi:MATE family efflux transporter [Granulicatella seriolae]|uniref:Membrane protein involved in the export of O-antigen and teichoic acid n=1 Tax=Granulicatella seriolae TaxID=2967226 RepID=A0ABT1WN46_9LACT|nr:hypothetical protein [Granulicatella seriolae]
MNDRLKRILANFGYLVSSNLLTVFISSFAILILPKLIGVAAYGYWQLYIFYAAYVGFFHLGWVDGIYLKYGGSSYSDLDKPKFYSQFVTFNFFLSFLAIGVLIFSQIFVIEPDRKFIFAMFALNILITNSRTYIVSLLQATNKIKLSSFILINDRVIYISLLLFLLAIGNRNYQVMVLSDVVAKLISLLYGVYICRDVLWLNIKYYSLDIWESIDNIRVGSQLMLSNVASMLIIGIVRFGVEKNWDIETFGKISLTLSISNLMMTFINAVGIVVFPLIKRVSQEQFRKIYSLLQNILMPGMFIILLLYFPLRIILNAWLPNYSESLAYMALVFPMSVYEGKMALLIGTYLKALRMEKDIFKVNFIAMMFSIFLTILTTVVFKNLEAALISIVILLALRSIIAELILAKRLQISVSRDILYELALTVIFIFVGWNFSIPLAAAIYVVVVAIYLVVKKNDIVQSFKQLKEI